MVKGEAPPCEDAPCALNFEQKNGEIKDGKT